MLNVPLNQYKAYSQQQSNVLQTEHQQRFAEKQAAGAQALVEVFSGEAYRNAPKWDEEAQQDLAKWIMDQGFTTQEISQVAEPRVFKWARDSYLREKELKAAKETVKKVTKITKVAKPGKSKPPAEISKSKNKDLKTRQRKSGGGLKETTDLISGLLDKR